MLHTHHKSNRYFTNTKASNCSFAVYKTSWNLAISFIRLTASGSNNNRGWHLLAAIIPAFFSKLYKRQCAYCSFTPVSPCTCNSHLNRSMYINLLQRAKLKQFDHRLLPVISYSNQNRNLSVFFV